jgi:phosphoglycolate phosphatase-like HAD superfamily hydrolase
LGCTGYLDFSIGAFRRRECGASRPGHGRAAQGAHPAYGFRLDEAATVLIGDTPRDVEAGRGGGAHVIAVCTGGVDAEALSEAGAHAVLEDLVDVDALVKAIHAVRLLGPAQPGSTVAVGGLGGS